MGKATGAGIVEGKGRQLITWAKSEQDAMGGKKAAFTQAAKLQLACKIPPSCFKTHVSPGVGVAAEVGGSQLPPPSFCKVPMDANVSQQWGFLLDLTSLFGKLDGDQKVMAPNPAAAVEHSTVPGSSHKSLQGRPQR